MLVKVNTKGAKGFFEFVKKAFPKTYVGLQRELSASTRLAGVGETINPVATATEGPVSSSIANTIREIATVVGQAYLTKEQLKAQQQILNVQLQRMQQGLAPLAIDPMTYGLPQPSVGISLDEGTKKLLIYGGIGLGLALMLGLIGGGRAARSSKH